MDFCALTLDLSTLLYNCLYRSLWILLDFQHKHVQRQFISSFPICVSSLSLFFLTALARMFSMILKRGGGERHPYLVPDISGKASSFPQ